MVWGSGATNITLIITSTILGGSFLQFKIITSTILGGGFLFVTKALMYP